MSGERALPAPVPLGRQTAYSRWPAFCEGRAAARAVSRARGEGREGPHMGWESGRSRPNGQVAQSIAADGGRTARG
eukprot:9155606-Alexandrium_andersonii.AAC.1